MDGRGATKPRRVAPTDLADLVDSVDSMDSADLVDAAQGTATGLHR